MSYKWTGALVGLAFFGVGGAAHASLIGDTVNASTNNVFAVSLSSTTAEVTTGGPEFVLDLGTGRAINIDVDESWIDFQYNNVANAGFFNQGFAVTLSDLDWVGIIGAIVDVQLTRFETGSLPPDTNTVSFTSDSVTLTLAGWWDATDRVRLDLTTTHAVPGPSSLALFFIGLLGIGLVMLREKNSPKEYC